MVELLIGIAILALVAWFVTVPLRRAPGAPEPRLEDPRLAELEARKQAKYREIRDTELDHAAGKIATPEFARQDAELRREAIAILKEIDVAEAEAKAEASERTPSGP